MELWNRDVLPDVKNLSEPQRILQPVGDLGVPIPCPYWTEINLMASLKLQSSYR